MEVNDQDNLPYLDLSKPSSRIELIKEGYTEFEIGILYLSLQHN